VPIFQQLLNELAKLPPDQQVGYINRFRTEQVKEIAALTGRGLLVYAADFKKSLPPQFGITNSITWEDKTCFADLVDGFDSKQVDVLIHSPGGSVEATESLVALLRDNFDEVRFFVPNTAKSAATMLALSGDLLLMDDRSELGPIDPQILINGLYVPAQTVIDGFDEAKERIKTEGPDVLPAYLPLLSKYDLHVLQICENAKELSKRLVAGWLAEYMFKARPRRKVAAGKVAKMLADHKRYLSHARPIRIAEAKAMGLNVLDLREHGDLRNRVWSLYCIIELLFDRSPIMKLYESSKGVLLLKQIPVMPPQPRS